MVKMVKLSDYIFGYLKNKGIKHAFMLPGGGAMHLVDSLGNSGIDYIPFLHEQGASVAAEAYGQHTNTPGLVVVTSGPGATNAITAVTAGWIDSTPMIIISGQAKRSDLVGDKKVRQIGSQEVQVIPMVSGITKYAVQVLEPEDIRYHMERAYDEALSGRPGPVWIEVPLDVQGAMIDPESLRGYEPDIPDMPDVKPVIERVKKCLIESRKPLFIAGNGIKLAGAESLAAAFLSLVKMPVLTTWKTIDMFAEDDEYYVGHPGIMGDRGANHILQEADFILSVGSRLDTSITAFNDRHFGMNAKKVIIDIDKYELARMDMDTEAALACDAKVFLEELISSCRKDEGSVCAETLMDLRTDWIRCCKDLRKKYPVVTAEHKNVSGYVSAYYFTDRLCELLSSDDVIVPESSGGAGEITYQAFRIKKGQKMKNAAGLGSMGFGLPYSIGACIANDRKRTILINGDGAFQLNIQELETLHRLGLPVKMFILCNDGYASIRSMQRNNFEGHYVGSSSDSGHTIPDIRKVAEAYGFRTVDIADNGQLDKILPEIMADNEPCLCTLHMDPNETVSPRVKAYVGKDGKMTSGLLENMWPPV